MAVDYNKNRQPVLSRFYLDDLNSKGVIVWVAPVIECKSHRLCPINALFSNIVIGQTEPDLESIHTYWSPLNLPIKWHQIYSVNVEVSDLYCQHKRHHSNVSVGHECLGSCNSTLFQLRWNISMILHLDFKHA